VIRGGLSGCSRRLKRLPQQQPVVATIGQQQALLPWVTPTVVAVMAAIGGALVLGRANGGPRWMVRWLAQLLS